MTKRHAHVSYMWLNTQTWWGALGLRWRHAVITPRNINAEYVTWNRKIVTCNNNNCRCFASRNDVAKQRYSVFLMDYEKLWNAQFFTNVIDNFHCFNCLRCC